MNAYRAFLNKLGRELIEMLGECENMGFHHKGEGTPEFSHYLRLATWICEVSERLARYDYIKGKNRPARPRPTAKDAMDRYLSKRGDSGRDAGRRGLNGDALSVLKAWADLSPDDSGPEHPGEH